MTLRPPADPDKPGAAPPYSLSAVGVALGTVLADKYRIEAVLASGGMGVVLRATHLELESSVAIKVMRAEHVAHEEVVLRLMAEARVAAGLRSKHVNRVLDVGRTPAGVPYLVLEYLEGSDLAQYVARSGRLAVSELCDYVLQACEALAEAHVFGIVHRDLKPENLFLSEDVDGGFVLKILDFGICKAPPARRGGRMLTDPFEVIGSPTYMAPEQIRGDAVDARTDIWALGTLLYELATGEVLFGAATATETFRSILSETEPLPRLPPVPGSEQLRAVIARCLRRNPAERFQDVSELACALAPLATEPQRAARVAKVAANARSRLIAGTGDALAGLTLSTPMALTTSQSGSTLSQARSTTQLRAWWHWLLIGVAAAAPPVAVILYQGHTDRVAREERALAAAPERGVELPSLTSSSASASGTPVDAGGATARPQVEHTN